MNYEMSLRGPMDSEESYKLLRARRNDEAIPTKVLSLRGGTTKQSRELAIIFMELLRFARNDREYSGGRFAPFSQRQQNLCIS
ncbi:MAG: hypothetical protein GWO87_02280 [Xanthomonadaceae bacterium]|nr:hypothetical protein [Rhodospirillaceae bacterium]NIA17994.1 hypothetical protein [Xanthomonadaceae bacterium]